MRETRTALYRFYDDHEALLYVGITNDPWRRQRQHVQEKSWYPRVKHQAITWYDTEPEARRAEAHAIRADRPLFNVAGALRPPGARFQVRFYAVLFACGFYLLAYTFAYFPMAALLRLPYIVQDIIGVSTLIPLLMMPLIAGAPWLCRFGCWLTRNFRLPEPGEQS